MASLTLPVAEPSRPTQEAAKTEPSSLWLRKFMLFVTYVPQPNKVMLAVVPQVCQLGIKKVLFTQERCHTLCIQPAKL